MSSPFRTPQAPNPRRNAQASSGKPPKHPLSDTKDRARRSSARNLASSALNSPGVVGAQQGKNILSPLNSINMGTPNSGARKSSPGSDSPFREWANSSLGGLADVVSPVRDDAAMLPPSYSDLSTKMENSPIHTMSSRDEDSCAPTAGEVLSALEHNLRDEATNFPPSGLGLQNKPTGKAVSDKSSNKNANVGVRAHSGAARPVRQPETAYEDPLAPLEQLSANLYTPQPAMESRKPMVLTECHLFTFELREDRTVTAEGFDHISPAAHHSVPASRSKSRPVPHTPAFDSETPEHMMQVSSGGKRICSCKKSRCLKLYCECFAAGDLCGGCKCLDCANDGQHEPERLRAVDSIKQRNSNAFAPKIVDEEQDRPVGAHARGCRCKKSHCLKKYCECFQASVKCTDKCKCEDCKNMSVCGPDETPRERAELKAFSALIGNPHLSGGSKGSSPSSSGRHMGRKGGLSVLSPPRNKKPRVLDFNVTATPSHVAQDASSSASPASVSHQQSLALLQALIP